MKIRSLELHNFRKFVDPVRIDGIGDGVNILVGPNEYGKSTLLDAINAVIFEKATAQSERTRSFRHYCNGTVPQVELSFDLDGTRWRVAKRFAGQSGRASLTNAKGHRIEDDAAEVELQRLLGFARRPRSSEPGIWGTLWVQQGKSFGDVGLDEHGRRDLQGCLEAQIGIVTGGRRGQRIPAAVARALAEIKNTRGPCGKFKEVKSRLEETRAEIEWLAAKRDENFAHMDELARLRRDRRQGCADWDEDAHQRELNEVRQRRLAAATKAAQIAAARSAAMLAGERVTGANSAVADRQALVADLDPLRAEFVLVETKFTKAEARCTQLKRQLDTAEGQLARLRERQRSNIETTRRQERVRVAQTIAAEIEQHRETLARAGELKSEVRRLAETAGANPATDANLARAEEAAAELAAARAAVNAVATMVSFALDADAVARVRVSGNASPRPVFAIPVVTRTVIAIEGVGEIGVEPQVADREAMIERLRRAEDDMRAALVAVAAEDLPAARLKAAQRRELLRQVTEMNQEIGRLAPADRARGLPAGLEARETRLGGLAGRLTSELAILGISNLPPSAETEDAVSEMRRDAELIAADIETADAAVDRPKQALAEELEVVQALGNRLAGLRATLAGKEDQLTTSRAGCCDEELSARARARAGEAAAAAGVLADLEQAQGETVDQIDVRTRRLEAASRAQTDRIQRLNQEISRLEWLIEKNEAVGVEEDLSAAQREEYRLATQVKAYEEEVAVLELLCRMLREAESEAKQRYLAPVRERAEPYLKTILPGSGLKFDENLGIDAIERRGAVEAFTTLSAGTQEQLAVLTRLAFAELLIDQGRPATVILDDALVFSDDDRIERMFDILTRAGEKVQIIVLTCRRRLFVRLGAASLQIIECGAAAA